MSPRVKNILKYLLFIGLGSLLFYLAFRNTEFAKLADDFRNARYEYVIASMIMGYVAFVSRGIRWKYLLDPMGHQTNTWNAIHAVTIGYLTNFLVPRAGEVARCTTLYRTDKIPVNKLFGTVIVERLVDMLMLSLLILLTIFLEMDKLSGFFAEAMGNSPEDEGSWGWKLIVALIFLGLFILAYFLRNHFRAFPLYTRARDFYIGFKEGLKSFKKVEKKGMFLFHTLLIWLMYFAMSYVVVFALDSTQHIDPASGLFIMIVGAMGIIVPSPGGVGSFHYLVMLGMGVIGIAADDALSYATLAHTGQTLMTLLAGLVSLYFLDRMRRRRKKEESLNTPPDVQG